MTLEQEIEYFESITKQMNEVFKNKRSDYGATTTETYKLFGMVSMLTRMHDKLGRLDNLCKPGKQIQVSNEKIEDTLLDLANYAVIALLELYKEWDEAKVKEVSNGRS